MIRHADVTLPNHDERVEALVQQVRELAVTGQTAHIDKGGVHHLVPRPDDARFRSRKLDTSALCHVLEIDPEGRRCVAEPGVSFRDLVRATEDPHWREILNERTIAIYLKPPYDPRHAKVTLMGIPARDE